MSGRVWQGCGWELREGRWEDSSPEVVDHVIADPPYDAKTHNGAVDGFTGRRTFSFSAGLAPIERLLGIAQRWVLLCCSFEQLGLYAEQAGNAWVRAGVWWKKNAMPQFSGDRPAICGEAIAVAHRVGARRWNGKGKAALWIGNKQDNGDHETQKPLWLMRALIEDFTNPGDLVWDPYAGSATTGVACLQLGRRFLGHEMQPRYAEVAAERLAAAENGQTLTQARAGQGVLFAKGKP